MFQYLRNTLELQYVHALHTNPHIAKVRKDGVNLVKYRHWSMWNRSSIWRGASNHIKVVQAPLAAGCHGLTHSLVCVLQLFARAAKKVQSRESWMGHLIKERRIFLEHIKNRPPVFAGGHYWLNSSQIFSRHTCAPRSAISLLG